MLCRTCTTSSGSTHQSDQENNARSNDGFDLDLFARGDLIGDALRELNRESKPGSLDRLGVGIEGEHACGVGRDSEREATVAAAQLEHTLVSEVAEPPQRGEMSAFRVDDATHRRFGL
jgi:hypothetical protein